MCFIIKHIMHKLLHIPLYLNETEYAVFKFCRLSLFLFSRVFYLRYIIHVLEEKDGHGTLWIVDDGQILAPA